MKKPATSNPRSTKTRKHLPLSARREHSADISFLGPKLAKLEKDVTRFLTGPDLRVRHNSLDFDLTVTSVASDGDGVVTLACTSADLGGYWRFPLAELVAAGPVNDAARVIVRSLTKAMVNDAMAKLVADGKLKAMPDYDAALVEEAMAGHTAEEVEPPQSEPVHHRSAHPEYVMDPNSPHTDPGENPLDGQ